MKTSQTPQREGGLSKADKAYVLEVLQLAENRANELCDGSPAFWYYMLNEMESPLKFYHFMAYAKDEEITGQYLLFKFKQIEAGVYNGK